MMEQPRNRIGQFAEVNGSTPGGESDHNVVMGDAQQHMGGTFYYPPKFKTAQQAIEFWATVPIPDTPLSAFRNGYKFQRQKWYDDQHAAMISETMNAWERQHPRPPKPPLASGWNAKTMNDQNTVAYQRAMQAWQAEWSRVAKVEGDKIGNALDRERPKVIYRNETRLVARAALIERYGRNLPGGEILESYRVEGMEEYTVPELNRRYNLPEILDYLLEDEYERESRQQQRLVDEVRNMSTTLTSGLKRLEEQQRQQEAQLRTIASETGALHFR